MQIESKYYIVEWKGISGYMKGKGGYLKWSSYIDDYELSDNDTGDFWGIKNDAGEAIDDRKIYDKHNRIEGVEYTLVTLSVKEETDE